MGLKVDFDTEHGFEVKSGYARITLHHYPRPGERATYGVSLFVSKEAADAGATPAKVIDTRKTEVPWHARDPKAPGGIVTGINNISVALSCDVDPNTPIWEQLYNDAKTLPEFADAGDVMDAPETVTSTAVPPTKQVEDKRKK